ncbi:MAG: hypothetical protein ACFFH0_04395 [Promethearchaeota archaeon]
MRTDTLTKKFNEIGAEVEILPARPRQGTPLTVDVGTVDGKESFILRGDVASAQVLQTLAKERHLLLMVKNPDFDEHYKIICGHDERHWFAANVPGDVRHVKDALQSLRPRQIRGNEKDVFSHKTDEWLRQGEWYFVPAPDFRPEKNSIILRSEPIQRPGSTAHIVEELCRYGGETVYVCDEHRGGLTEEEYKALSDKERGDASRWRVMRRNANVYAKGTVRHPDHNTITLSGWHRVLLNEERTTVGNRRAAGPVVFLD